MACRKPKELLRLGCSYYYTNLDEEVGHQKMASFTAVITAVEIKVEGIISITVSAPQIAFPTYPPPSCYFSP